MPETDKSGTDAPADEAEGQELTVNGESVHLSKAASDLLKSWKPGKPVPGGTFVTGLGSRQRKPLSAPRNSDEAELGL